MKSYWIAGAFFVMACLTGSSLFVASAAYNAYLSRTNALAATYGVRFARIIKVTTVDLPNRRITGEILDTGSALTGPVTFTVHERTRLEKRLPVVENGILVKLSPALPATASELQPGSTVFARLIIEPDGTLTANYLLLNDPLQLSY